MYRQTSSGVKECLTTDIQSQGTVHLERCPDKVTGVMYRRPESVILTTPRPSLTFSGSILDVTENIGLESSPYGSEVGIL